MKILVTSKLSKNMYKTPQGYLVCQNAILSRTGTQQYLKSEVYPNCDDDTIIEVDRKEEQVFSPEAMASFENMPLTNEHPYENVTTENYKEYAVGFVRDIKKGKFRNKPVMMGTLVVTDPDAIADIEAGKRDLSCGYDCDITDGDHPEQINIRGNHVALCEQGRAGIARIVDSADTNYIPGYTEKVVKSFAKDAEDFVAGAVYEDIEGTPWKIVDIQGTAIVLENNNNIKNTFDVKVFSDLLAKRAYRPLTKVSDTKDVFIEDGKTLVEYYLWPGAGYSMDKGVLELEGKVKEEEINWDEIFADAYKKNLGYFISADSLTEKEYEEYDESDRFTYEDLTMEGVDFVGFVCIENATLGKIKYVEEIKEEPKEEIVEETQEEIKDTEDVFLKDSNAEYSQKFYKKLDKAMNEADTDLCEAEFIVDEEDEEDFTRQKKALKRELRTQILKNKENLK